MCREWSFQGYFKRTRTGCDVTYNLEFKLPSILEYFHMPIDPTALEIDHNATAHSKSPQTSLKAKKSRVPWSEEEDAILQTRKDGCSWEEISAALPRRSKGTIQVRYSTKFNR